MLNSSRPGSRTLLTGQAVTHEDYIVESLRGYRNQRTQTPAAGQTVRPHYMQIHASTICSIRDSTHENFSTESNMLSVLVC